MKKKLFYSVMATLFASPVFAEDLELDSVSVKSSGFERKESQTTYASEIHTAKQIAASGASTLFDYLAQQSSLNISSNFGSKATPSINLRGYGSENGYQNVVITVDGQRLNNIDMSPQLLVGIPLANIERIEISKGSGSVLYGDGATAGAIQIYTKSRNGASVMTSAGNYGQRNHAISAGFSSEHIDLSASASHDSHDGFSAKDRTGHRDAYDSNTQQVKLRIKPTEQLAVYAQGSSTKNDLRYPNPMSKAQFEDNPSQNGRPATSYTHQELNSDQWQIGLDYQINTDSSIEITHFREDKASIYPSYRPHYDYEGTKATYKYTNDQWSVISGFQDFNGAIKTSSDLTKKNNHGLFISSEFKPQSIKDLRLSAGLRKEQVSYTYTPNGGDSLNRSIQLSAWDLGANYQLMPSLSLFSNYNYAFEAPDINRFFGYDASFNVVFNGFIKPQKVRTLNIGLNHTTTNNHLKLSAFRANLDNEIYYDPSVLGINTNLDKSHKLGFELQDIYHLSNELNVGLIYTYTKAIIDRELQESGTLIKDKNLPGAPRQSLVANINWKIFTNTNLNLNHVWRSQAYVYNDFLNNATQRQSRYESTNLSLNVKVQQYTVFAAVNNLFEHQNNIQTAVDSLYPIDFVRTWRVGLKADF
ncbi:TonB-dependent receptor [Methylophilus sp. DW102]|uniref:TonB-dependent receptor n=1 Tax=Methylophilus sp. DW102 TaxID=3095607 RepID=UPI003088CDED|nr:TonB-dependent receptor [Methylophilus sp. DW102]